jgi:hypothetical protein
VARLRDRLVSGLQLRPGAAELSFHACWLRHARNERRAGENAGFLEIAQWAARRALEAR